MSCKRKRKRYSDRLIEIHRSPIKSSFTAKFMFSWGENIGAIFFKLQFISSDPSHPQPKKFYSL